MSDDDFEYEYDSDDQGDDQEDDQDDDAIQIENAFYEADDCKGTEPEKAVELFEKVVKLESERGDEVKWRFRALENLVTLCHKLGRYEEMEERHGEMLKYLGSVTRNECTESINSLLTIISGMSNLSLMSNMIQRTLSTLKDASNHRLWFNMNVKLGKLFVEMKKFTELRGVIQVLREFCHDEDGNDDIANKGSYLIDVYSLEIQLCRATKDTKRMKEIYPKTLNMDAVVADPRIMGLVREEGGKMYLSEERWEEAYNEFFEAFRNFQESGNSRAKECLKCVVLANMLSLSDIDPFDSREAKVYKDDPEIAALINLRLAYSASDIKDFEKILKDPKGRIATDKFIMSYIDPLLRKIRSQILMQIVQPYERIKLDFLGQEINISQEEVESLLVELILDQKLQGKINQVGGFLTVGAAKSVKKYAAIKKWSDVLVPLDKYRGSLE